MSSLAVVSTHMVVALFVRMHACMMHAWFEWFSFFLMPLWSISLSLARSLCSFNVFALSFHTHTHTDGSVCCGVLVVVVVIDDGDFFKQQGKFDS
jgi:hypothetical protein